MFLPPFPIELDIASCLFHFIPITCTYITSKDYNYTRNTYILNEDNTCSSVWQGWEVVSKCQISWWHHASPYRMDSSTQKSSHHSDTISNTPVTQHNQDTLFNEYVTPWILTGTENHVTLYLTKPSVIQTIRCWMVALLANSELERMQKRVVMAWFEVLCKPSS